MRAGSLAAGAGLGGQELFGLLCHLPNNKADGHRVGIGDDRRGFSAGDGIEAVGPEEASRIRVDLVDCLSHQSPRRVARGPGKAAMVVPVGMGRAGSGSGAGWWSMVWGGREA